MQFSVQVRNATLDAVEATIGVSPTLTILTGSAPANAAAADPGTVLATMVLPVDWMSAAVNGVKQILGNWSDLEADAGGVAGHFRITKSGVCGGQGTCGLAGSGAQMIMSNTTLVQSQPVNVTSCTLTAGGA